MTKVLGIESTAHSFGAGMVTKQKILSNVVKMHQPELGGIRPSEAARHHREVAEQVIREAMVETPDAMAYSASPGIGSCLSVGAEITKKMAIELKIPIIPINHAISHLEIGLRLTKAKDPVVVYVSGGNTQLLANKDGWRVFVGNFSKNQPLSF